MKPKLKPGQDLEAVQDELVKSICSQYKDGVSIRSIAGDNKLSPMKVRKILITGGVYSTDLSEEILAMFKEGMSPSDIGEALEMTSANVNSYLPYERIIYGMPEKSVEADRQQRYRDRKKNQLSTQHSSVDPSFDHNTVNDHAVASDHTDHAEEEKTDHAEDERREAEEEKVITQKVSEKKRVIGRMVRMHDMIIVFGKKLRKIMPKDIYNVTTDPLARDHGFGFDPPDPAFNIWCAEIAMSGRGRGGRGKDKKQGIVLANAASGFTVVSRIPEFPYTLEEIAGLDERYDKAESLNKEDMKMLLEIRRIIEGTLIESIRRGMLEFCYPEEKVDAYLDVNDIQILKAKPSTPMVRLEEYIKNELEPVLKQGDDLAEVFRVRSNCGDRKFGNSPWYRSVTNHTADGLGLTEEERKVWNEGFWREGVPQ